MRQGLLWLSGRQGIFNFVRRNRLARKFASRFVAGETVETGVEAVQALGRKGITASLDLLGESVTQEAEAVAARDQYLRMLERMAAGGVEVNVSVKLTQMGLDIREELCLANMTAILERARTLGGFVRLDMEGSDYTQRTLDFFSRHLFPDVRRPLWSGDPVDAPPIGEGRGATDRHAGARAALQGRVSGARRRWRSPTRPTSTATTSS